MQFPYRKILVVGCGGAGKSTFALEMGKRFGLPVVHLDRLWWLPDWVERDREEFDGMLKEELGKPSWVIDGNYRRTLPLRLSYCDAVVFLDIPAEECLKNAYARAEMYRGRTRPDMTEGCIEEVHDDFKQWIERFNTDVRGELLRDLEGSGKPYFVFGSRESAYAWLDGFQRIPSSEARRTSF